MNPASALAPDATIAVLGAGRLGTGRLGTVLARALRAAEFDVRGPLGRDDEIPDSDIALLCVPDAAIADAATRARPHARLIGHVSGATGLEGVDFSIHPLQTFSGKEEPEVFHGIGAAIAGRTPDVRDTARDLARTLGARPFEVDDAHRATYHAAASFASNFVLTVLDAAEQLATTAGIDNPRELLAPLARQTVENWMNDGAKNALTGPIARGDEATVARQRAAAPDKDLFDALAAATRALKDRA
ncbi:DUF2520 domain-containing protein [Microbacterium sp. SD291]|nr:DUF2520 domain-containing protein [Microbacterium sp. SD291]